MSKQIGVFYDGGASEPTSIADQWDKNDDLMTKVLEVPNACHANFDFWLGRVSDVELADA